jgi:hypothetical protein
MLVFFCQYAYALAYPFCCCHRLSTTSYQHPNCVMLMHMQPDNQTPPAPPPITPGGPQDQYNFIMNPGGPAPKKSLLPSDKKKKMLLFVGGGVTLLIVLLMLISILSNRPNDITDQLVTIAKQQNELIRIAENRHRKKLALRMRRTWQLQRG